MKTVTLLLLTFGLAIFGFSGGGCGRTMMSTPLVNAAGFSDASLSGGYSFADSGETLGSPSIRFNEVGVLTFDGAGRFSGNSTTNNGGRICAATVTGTYRINSDGSGSAMVTQTPDAASAAGGCTTVFFPAVLGLSSGGMQVQFIEISSSEILIGSALKQ
jgi:hypothetical protein